MNYSQKLRDPRWQKKRLQILSRDEFTCTLCKDKQTTLHIHHEEYFGDPWDVEDGLLITCCEHCHQIIEFFKKHELLVKGIVKYISEEDGEVFMAVVDSLDQLSLIRIIDGKMDVYARLNEEILDNISNFYKSNIINGTTVQGYGNME